MSDTVLIAAELQELLGSDPVPHYAVEWIATATPTPKGDYVAIIPLLSRWIGGEQLKGLPRLEIVANCAVGVDNIDLVAAELRGIVVTNTPDVLTEATADLTWALLMAVARRLKEGQELIAAGKWTGWHPQQLLGTELGGATLGIVGAGRIGQAVARRARACGMRIVYADRVARSELEESAGAERRELAGLLRESDVVSIHVPATAGTRGMFDARRLAQMKPGSFLINTSRGDIVREPELIDALARGHLGGAGLDVFADEPIVPQELVRHPRVVVLPHLGSATTVTRRAMATLAAKNVRAVLAGEPPVTPVVSGRGRQRKTDDDGG